MLEALPYVHQSVIMRLAELMQHVSCFIVINVLVSCEFRQLEGQEKEEA